jgi:hypothetical protein
MSVLPNPGRDNFGFSKAVDGDKRSRHASADAFDSAVRQIRNQLLALANGIHMIAVAVRGRPWPKDAGAVEETVDAADLIDHVIEEAEALHARLVSHDETKAEAAELRSQVDRLLLEAPIVSEGVEHLLPRGQTARDWIERVGSAIGIAYEYDGPWVVGEAEHVVKHVEHLKQLQQRLRVVEPELEALRLCVIGGLTNAGEFLPVDSDPCALSVLRSRFENLARRTVAAVAFGAHFEFGVWVQRDGVEVLKGIFIEEADAKEFSKGWSTARVGELKPEHA